MKDLTIGIVGLGMIGNSEAVLSTMHGYKTICIDALQDRYPVYKQKFDTMYDEMITEGVITAEQAEICKSYLFYAKDYAELAECDFVFEAVTENIEIKKEVYAQLEANCPKLKVICSGSSSFVPDKLAASATKYADRIIVSHPFFPVHMVPYFELCASSKTADGVVDFAKSVLEKLDRKPVVLNKPWPGFIGNYLQFALWAAALKLVEEGVCDPKAIDTCLNYSFCPRYTSIGIFDHFDNGGYKLNVTTCDSVFPILPRYDGAPEAITSKAYADDGWGANSPSQKGFYDWSGVDRVAYQKKVNAPYWKFINWEFPKEKCQ